MASSVWNDNKVLKKWVKKHQDMFFDGNFNFNMMDLLSDPLLGTIADKLNIDKKYIYVGAGSSQFIPSVLGLKCWKKVFLATPEFGLYTRSVRYLNLNYEEIFSKTCKDFVDRFIKTKSCSNDILVISSPRWFSGERFTRKQIELILSKFKGCVLVDEAYISYSNDDTGLIDLAMKNDRLIILRSLSKKYFLSGNRVGYLVTKRKIDGFRETIIPPHSISTFSQRFCVEMLNDERITNIFNNTVKLINSNRDYLYEKLIHNNKIEVFASESNFITFIVKNENNFKDIKERISDLPGIQFFELEDFKYIKVWISDKKFSDLIIDRLN